MILALEDLELDLSEVELRRSGVRVPVEPQVFEVLAYLVNHRDRVVAKDESSECPARRLRFAVRWPMAG